MRGVKLGLSFGIVVLLGVFGLSEARGENWRIVASRKKTEIKGAAKKKTNGITLVPEGMLYEIKVTNSAFKATPASEARYLIFVERQRPATRPTEDVVEKLKGEAALPALKSGETKNLESEPFVLWTGSLESGYYFENGGRIRTKDRLVGIWVKIFQDGKEVAEYANPSSLVSQHQWQP